MAYKNNLPPLPFRKQNSNKGTFGKVLNICGSKNYIGAAYLPTLSSLKVGAGYSALYSTTDVISSVSAILPEAVYIKRGLFLTNLNNYNVFLIGCGLGLNILSLLTFNKVISKLQKDTRPVVIDADGLNLLAKHPIKIPVNTVITPHPAEAARLLGVKTDEILKDFIGSAKKLTKKYRCVTVLKSHNTVVCDKNGDIYVNQHGNSALAKAGSGDVLAGVISGLLAQGMDLFEAAKLGVYLHSRAGEIASEELTEYSVLASDIPKYLPKAIREII